MKRYRIALAGNPNCGKTCIFNALTGARQHVGNYPGVTVENKSGRFFLDGQEVEVVDLPGIYSLSSHSPEERVVFQELTAAEPKLDLILNVIDSSIPERSLYLTTQLAELGIPMMLVLNMSDEADRKKIHFDHKRMEEFFGVHVVRTVGRTEEGVRPLLEALSVFLHYGLEHGPASMNYGEAVDGEIQRLQQEVQGKPPVEVAPGAARFFATKLLERDSTLQQMPAMAPLLPLAEESLKRLGAQEEDDTFLARRRYALLGEFCRQAIVNGEKNRRDFSRKADALLTHRFLGLPIFLLVIFLTFFFTFHCAQPFMDWIDAAFGWLGDLVKEHWSEETLPYLRSMVADGVIAGVGGVLVFLPNILFLFLAIALLEDSGYMARAAFVMDGLMRKFGLHGRAFVPLVLGFGCNVPAIMATRTIESEWDRKATILVLPLMSCGARLPIYSLIIPVFFTGLYRPLVMWGIYLLGVAVALAARLMKSTLFRGEGEVFLMELPPYRCPSLRALLLHMWDRGKMYLHKAGTIILLTSIVLFLCNTLPSKDTFSRDYLGEAAALEETMPEGEERENALAVLENARAAEELEYTLSGRVGKFLEPVFRPIGFDWKLVTASIAGLAAKEVFVSQLGILYAEGEADEESEGLRAQIREAYTPLQGVCIMIFTLMSIPCFATLAVIRRELNSWKWCLLEACGLFLLAYGMTFLVYQAGCLLGWG